jgi:hypothetical protein
VSGTQESSGGFRTSELPLFCLGNVLGEAVQLTCGGGLEYAACAFPHSVHSFKRKFAPEKKFRSKALKVGGRNKVGLK